ncbi:MAG: DUF2207 domain-containing protein [Candidatus Kerfeldbacteria bacterium]|nr:DUF2207 domain-containing protein [Candidatus Kerfeldbacteria bacterium]
MYTWWRLIIGVVVLAANIAWVGTVQAESIDNFIVRIDIQPDATVFIEESITYDFGYAYRHGIFRNIPVRYDTDTGDTRWLWLTVDSVLRDDQLEPYTVSSVGRYRQIKIGDPDSTIDGKHTYRIRYRVEGAINYFNDLDELYWNITGNEWTVVIDHAEAMVRLPGTVSDNDLRLACYVGPVEGTNTCPITVRDGRITAQVDDLLVADGLTIAVGWPKNIVSEPGVWLQARLWWWRYWGIIVFGSVTVVMALVWLLFGKDPKGRPTIVPQYEPPAQLKPTLVGTLIDEHVHNRDITAGILWLAQQGFITIEQLSAGGILKKPDYRLTLRKPLNSITETIEQRIAELIFQSETSVTLKTIRNDLQRGKKLQALRSDIYGELVKRGLYKHNPTIVRVIFIFLAVAVTGILVLSVEQYRTGISLAMNFVTGAVIVIFGWLMARKTKLGAETKDDVVGFKWFLRVTDQARFTFHNAPAKKPTQFMEYLPYAVALGVEQQWAEQFKDINIPAPDWYIGTAGGYFVASQFVSNFSTFTNSMTSGLQAASAKSASTSGGSSGGGFGGGGGGSW